MRQLILLFAFITLLSYLAGCGQGDKSKLLKQYKYDDGKDVEAIVLNKKLDSWVKEGITCYGIIIVYNDVERPTRVREVYAKVISIEPDKIVMRSLENIAMSPVKGCVKFSLSKGEDWNEVEGDLFLTKEEAIKFIDSKYPGLRVKN